MIITSAPFRIAFMGGGSDLPAFYRRQGGAVLSATINRFVYISIHPFFLAGKSIVKYSKNEMVSDVGQIKHPIFCEALKALLPEGGVEIVSTADVPSGTGLGSSSTFTVALLHALHAYCGRFRAKQDLAREACELEIGKLGEPIGKQDQYAASFGGLNCIEFYPDERVVVSPLVLPGDVVKRLEENLLLFYAGGRRRARDVLRVQALQLRMDQKRRDNLEKVVGLVHETREALTQGNLGRFGELLDKGWTIKRTLSSSISNERIDKYYTRAREFGALGGKLLGAGGGGFLLLYCEKKDQERLRKALFDLHEMPFRFDWMGTRIVHIGEQYVDGGFITQRS